jgi:Mg/Co/Ni transporter MgtE
VSLESLKKHKQAIDTSSGAIYMIDTDEKLVNALPFRCGIIDNPRAAYKGVFVNNVITFAPTNLA